MNTTKELILFIPGISDKKQGEYLEMLMGGITNYCEGNGIPLVGSSTNDDDSSITRKIELQISDTDKKIIDIKEIYWGDLRPNLSAKTALVKMIRGFDLLIYWALSPNVWRQRKYSQYLVFNMIITLLILVLWYIGILSLGLKAIGLTSFTPSLSPGFTEWFLEKATELGNSIANMNLWLPSTLIMSIIPINNIINTIHSAKSYIQNRDGLFHKSCGRIRKEIINVLSNNHDYNKVTVLSHSFGVVLSTEVLANLSIESTTRIHKVSLGGPLRLVSAKSNRVKNAIDKVVSNSLILKWSDFYSNGDWLCTSSPVNEDNSKYSSTRITTSVPFDEKFSGKSHNLYFRDWDVLKNLLH